MEEKMNKYASISKKYQEIRSEEENKFGEFKKKIQEIIDKKDVD